MFYQEEEISCLLSCPKCKQRYTDARIVPCSRTICVECIDASTHNNEYKCTFCNSTHRIPDGGFMQNDIVVSMLKLKPAHVSRSSLVEEFKENMAKLASLVHQLDKSKQSLKADIHEHCASLKNKIDLASERRLDEINEIRLNMLAQVDAYEQECVRNVDAHKHDFFDLERERELDEHLNECTKYLANFRVDDQLVRDYNQKTLVKLDQVEKIINDLKIVQFNGKLLEFREHSNTPLEPESIGKFYLSRIKTKKTRKIESKTHLVSASADGSLKFWNLKDGLCEKSLEAGENAIYCVLLIPGRVICADRDSNIYIYNIQDESLVKMILCPDSWVSSLAAFDDNSDRLVSAGSDGVIRVWNLDSGECEQTLSGNPSPIQCLLAVNKNELISGGDDKLLKIWNLSEGTCTDILKGHMGRIWCCELVNNGLDVMTGSRDKTIKVWNLKTKECTQTLTGHTSDVYGVCSVNDDDDSLIASASRDETIRIWNIDEGTCVRVLTGHDNSIWCLISVDENTLASGSKDETIKIWNLHSGDCVRTLEGHNDQIYSICAFK